MKKIFMLEDDQDEHYLTKETMEETGIDVTIQFFSRPADMFCHLSVEEPPVLILVDNNIAPEGGIEVLKRLKAHDHYKSIPVVILSDNKLERYSREAYLHGASSYIMKPLSMADTRKKIETFFKYWLEVAEV